MSSTEGLTYVTTTTAFPLLQQPKPETVDCGTVRLGAGNITAAFALLR